MARPLPILAPLLSTLILGLPATLLADGPMKAGGPKKEAEPPPPLAVKIGGLQAEEGFLRTYRDPARGVVWLELPAPEPSSGLVESLIYVEGLTTGLGSNPVGLDRGQLGETRVIDVRRYGNRVLFEQRNLAFRADSQDELERAATRESFATSVIWATRVAALDPDGTSLVDLTPFLLSDIHGVEATLRNTRQGAYKLDVERSAVDFAACLSFPDNLELEALLTYAQAADEPGQLVAATAPSGGAFSVRLHHSLVRLPDDGFRPRRGDPRAGFFGPQYLDYAASLEDSIDRWWIARHRLEKQDPAAARSPAVEPIVYYLDPGVPEPIRGALLDGARWWAEAFEAAGFIDAFRVEMLPRDAHPLDVRYNVIQWVHRSTRGWSYGGGVIDPRTGEILKGHVNLGSLRVRQDRLLFEGLLGTEKTGSGEADDPIQLALARIRQLSAHEVGHTLGITHNFAASTYGGRASVMDYPAPLISLTAEGELDVSKAYGVGVGAWDVHSVRYGYTQFPPGADEAAELERLLEEGRREGLLFLSDADARPIHASDPRANLWDNGEDAVSALEQSLEIRALALERFGKKNLPLGQPLARLEEVLAPVYFHHRFQLEAAAKTLGGLEYHYAVRGDGQAPPRPVSGERQRRALETLLRLLEPAELALPDHVLEVLTPRPFGSSMNREMFASKTWPAFDAVGAAESAADHVLRHVLEPRRLSRLLEASVRDASIPTVEQVLDTVIDKAFGVGTATPEKERARYGELRRAVQRVTVERLIALAGDEATPGRVRWLFEDRLDRLAEGLSETRGWHRSLARRIGRFLDRQEPSAAAVAEAASLPPGSPIGEPSPTYLDSWAPAPDAHGCGGFGSEQPSGGL